MAVPGDRLHAGERHRGWGSARAGVVSRDTVGRTRDDVQAAIAAASGHGVGHGPLDHAVTLDVSRIGRPG